MDDATAEKMRELIECRRELQKEVKKLKALLPKVVMSSDFESEWGKYMDAYNACKPEDFLAEMQEELDRRVEMGSAE